MTKNHKLLLSATKKITAELLRKGLTVLEAKEIIFPILIKWKAQIDNDNVLGAVLELDKLNASTAH